MVRRLAARPGRLPCTSASRPRDAIRPWSGAALWGGGRPGAGGPSWRRAARGAGPGAGDRGPRRGQTAPRLVRRQSRLRRHDPERGRDGWWHSNPYHAGRWSIWLGGAPRTAATVVIDGRSEGETGPGLSYGGQWVPSASRRSAPARTRSRCGCLRRPATGERIAGCLSGRAGGPCRERLASRRTPRQSRPGAAPLRAAAGLGRGRGVEQRSLDD